MISSAFRKITFAAALLAMPVLAVAAAETGSFRPLVSPKNAGVWINNEYAGAASMFFTTNSSIKLAPGKYEVRIAHPGYIPIDAKVEIVAGMTSTLNRRMTESGLNYTGPVGRLALEGYGNAAVYINGMYFANAAKIGSEGSALRLPPGSYELTLVPADGSPSISKPINIEADATLILHPTCAPVVRR